MALQKTFTGLNDFVGRYQLGELALDLSPNLFMALDAFDWIAPPKWEIDLGAGGATGSFYQIGAAIAAGKTRIIDMFSLVTTGGLSVQAAYTPRVVTSAGAVQIGLASQSANGIPGNYICRGLVLDRPIYVKEGDQVGWFAELLGVGAPPSIQIAYRYREINT